MSRSRSILAFTCTALMTLALAGCENPYPPRPEVWVDPPLPTHTPSPALPEGSAEGQGADLPAGIRSALTLMRPSVPAGVQLVDALPELPPLRCRASDLNQVFMTVLQNAIEAIDGEGTVRVGGEADADEIRVVVEDDGRGIEPERIADLFELRFSERGGRVRFHTGLATASETVRAHGGRIDVESAPGAGSRFTLRFPRAGLDSGPRSVTQ